MNLAQAITDLIAKIPGVTGCYVRHAESSVDVGSVTNRITADALAEFAAETASRGEPPESSFHFCRNGQKRTWAVDAITIGTTVYGIVAELPLGHPSHKSLRRSISRIEARLNKMASAA